MNQKGTAYPPKVAVAPGAQPYRPYVLPQPGSKEALRMRQRQERKRQQQSPGEGNLLGLDTRQGSLASSRSSPTESTGAALTIADKLDDLGLQSPRQPPPAELPSSLGESVHFSQRSSSAGSNLSPQVITPDQDTFSREQSRTRQPSIDEAGFGAGLTTLLNGLTRTKSAASSPEPCADSMLPSTAKGVAMQPALWKPDSLAEECDATSCRATFSLTLRRHHCRSCGQVFCERHSRYGLPLYHESERKVKVDRVCEDCWRKVVDVPDVTPTAPEERAMPAAERQGRPAGRRMFSNPPTPLSTSPPKVSRRNSHRKRALTPTARIFTPAETASPTATGYFPTMPTAPLPGEETRPVTGVLATYPLAHKSPSGLSTPTTSSPYGSTASLSVMGSVVPRPPASYRTASQASIRRNLPPSMRLTEVPAYDPSAEQPLGSRTTSEREWVPGQWGYDRKAFDPDLEAESSDEDEEGASSAGSKKRQLVVDGDFRFRAAQDANERKQPQLSSSGGGDWATF